MLIGATLLATMLTAGSPAVDASFTPITVSTCDFGLARPWSTTGCTIVIANDNDFGVIVDGVPGGDPRATAVDLPLTIAAKSSARLPVAIEIRDRVGRSVDLLPLTVRRVGAEDSPLQYMVPRTTGFVYSTLDTVRPVIAFGAVEAGGQASESLKLTSSDLPDFAVTKLLSAPDFTAVKVDAARNSIDVKISDSAPWGLNDGEVVVALNQAEEPEAHVKVTADVLGRVRPDSNPHKVDVLRTDGDKTFAIPLTSMDGKPFRVGEVVAKGFLGHAQLVPCREGGEGCKLLQFVLDPDQPVGPLSGTLNLDLPGDKQTLTIGVEGVLLNPGTEIRSINELARQSGGSKTGTTASESPDEGGPAATPDFARELKTRLKHSPSPADPPGNGPVLRWSVANEQPLYGYLIYRAEAESGPWQRVNAKIIPVLGHDDGASEYVWRDTSAVRGTTYWYFIKTLATDGSKEALTATQKVVAH